MIIVGMELFMGAVGIATLFLGGLGVMNVMLVSVRERTREIGVRMALGATRKSILRQFFMETVIVVALSGGTGLLVSYGFCALVNLLPMPPFFAGLLASWKLGALSVSLLGVISVLSALYPRIALHPSIPSKPCGLRRAAKMFLEIFREAWAALGRNPVRSLLTMTGISWGIVAVTLLLSYGSGFRNVLMYTFEVFGKGAVVCWPGTTSEQAGGERAGKAVRFEQEDADWVKAQSPLVKRVTLESVKFKGISHEERLSDTAIRGVYPEYGEMRNEVPLEGRWISQEDIAERRRVAFLGAILRKKLFSGTPAIGEACAHQRREIYCHRHDGHKIFR